MKKYMMLCVVFLLLVACSNNTELGSNPPKVTVEVDGENYETELGSYCWQGGTTGSGECADKVGPEELLNGKQPIVVQPEAELAIQINLKRQPDEVALEQVKKDQPTPVSNFKDSRFTAPKEKGTYFYILQADWTNQKEKNTSDGDAWYAFHVRVE
ncbi:hypothetical protein D6T70_12195 [Kurthia gibsonii]|uniref:hypothetical protein n=1 Tax=Kurthia gibsonii TaxID=33946 RepID=UPI000EB354BE|nr:hypothetical protein [Kurthia gibsonii]RXH51372.1 hypothetical protein D6T70_12195 [Kurthia gibsonii]